VIVATGEERAAIDRFRSLIAGELNVRDLRFVSDADELSRVEVKPNYRTLGPRFGRHMPIVAAAVAGLDPTHVTEALRTGRPVSIDVAGHDHELTAEDLLITMQPLEGYQLEREGSHAVALELEFDAELIAEMRAREAVRAIQSRRKDAGLQVSDRIHLTLDGATALLDAIRSNEGYVAGETLAVSVSYESLNGVDPVEIDELPLQIAIAVAPRG
jgi:isoleucyl-tRNA synthetase